MSHGGQPWSREEAAWERGVVPLGASEGWSGIYT